MADEGPLLGVSTAAPAPATWPAAAPTAAPATTPEPQAWPPAAQWLVAALLVVFLGLLAWRGYGLSSYSTRPLLVENESAPRDSIDVNRADVVDLRLVPGVGEKMARRIIEHRERRGPFRSLEELRQVSGVGPATLERIRPFLRIASYTQAEAPEPRVVRGAAPEPPAIPPTKGAKKPPPGEKIDVNRATSEQLRTLPGIGPTLAARIVEERGKRPFQRVEDLRRVKGVGAKTLERLRPYVLVEPPP